MAYIWVTLKPVKFYRNFLRYNFEKLILTLVPSTFSNEHHIRLQGTSCASTKQLEIKGPIKHKMEFFNTLCLLILYRIQQDCFVIIGKNQEPGCRLSRS